MPYIHVTANIPITEEQEKALAAGAGKAVDSAYEALTGELTRLAEQTLFIPRNRIYVQYEECRHWGFAGSNF